MRCGYSLAMDHYRKVVSLLTGSADSAGQLLLLEAGGSLARLLAVTGQLTELDALVALVAQPGTDIVPGSEWTWAREMRSFVQRNPTETYKCGLHCLDMLGRTTQSGQFLPKDVNETVSSTNGFNAGDLLNVAARAGLSVHAAVFTDTNNIPVPCVLHLRCEHFVFVREQRGAFYEVVDTMAYGPRWLTADEIVAEATGCVLVSDAVPPSSSSSLVRIDKATAAEYRGRCHDPLPYDHDDLGCDGTCPCPPTPVPPMHASSYNGPMERPGGNMGGGGSGATGGAGGFDLRKGNLPGFGLPMKNSCTTCSGMPSWLVSEPFLNLWVKDVPLEYESAYGLPVRLELAHLDRHYQSVVSFEMWHGGEFGNDAGVISLWSCSFLSFAELSSDAATVELMLPASGWVTFTFPTNAGVSSIAYRNNLWLEQQGPGTLGSVTNLLLHYPDGSTANYGLYDKSDPSFAVFYMTTQAGPDGIQTKFAYNNSTFYLTNVTAGDGTTFSVKYANASFPDAITGVTSSYGTSASFGYVGAAGATLSTITDAAGIMSQIGYFTPSAGDTITAIITPYGTTEFSIFGQSGYFAPFDRALQVTNADSTQELYAQMNSYVGTTWPDYLTTQVPTNTPIGTLDKDSGHRQERNTFYWNAQQFAPLIGLAFSSFDWAQFKQSRIQHWLASTNQSYTHWDTLSAEQAPSPDLGLTEGQLTWYDYVGKPTNVDYEIGTQILPSVIARVMPDGSTSYQYFKRNSHGLATNILEAWVDSGTFHTRSNILVYSTNNVDLLAWTNALGVLAISNVYNAYHEVVTNYDALGQVTTNGYDGTTKNITSSLIPSGLATLYSYNGSQRLQSVVDLPINRTNTYTWNSDGTVATSTDPRGLVESYFWDGLHRLTGTSDSRGTTTNLYYLLSGSPYPNSSGGTSILDVTASKDRMGYWTYYVYDALRREIAETNANGVVTAYGYCSCGAVNSVTNAWTASVQEVTTLNFDYQGRLLYTTYADSYNFTNWYDSLGRVIVTGDGTANRWLFYNNLNLLTVLSNAYGAELNLSYDNLDRPVYATDANGVTLTNTYDNLNRLFTRVYPDGGAEKFGYSAAGLTAYTNQLGMTNFFTYDAASRKTSETNANGEVLLYTNNAAGDLLSLTDGRSKTTRWGYDPFGRVTNKVDQVQAIILKYAYDADDRLISRYSISKGTTYYTNDPVGNLTYVKYPHGTNVSLQYDPLNRLTNMVDGVGTTKYSYTAGNQVLTESQPFSNSTITNTHVNRLRTSMSLQQPTGIWTNKFVYDSAARLTSVTSPAGVFGYTVGAASPGSILVKKLGLPNTSYITNTFDSVARLTGTYLENSGNTVLDSAVYGYNKANQRTAFTNAAGTYVQFAYDNIGQLIVATSSVGSETRGYGYDPAWNLHQLTNNGTTTILAEDNKNEMTTDPSSANNTYDFNGNLLTRPGLDEQTYVYDDENRLVGLTNGSYWASGFNYDGFGRLRKRTEFSYNGSAWIAGATTEYIYDGARVIQERDTNNTPTVSYTRGSDLSGSLQGAGGIGGLLARSSGYSSGNWSTNHFYHADGSGNVTYLQDSSQAMAATYRYDAFGNTLSSSGTWAAANVYRFSSQQIHINSGMYMYLYRCYDPGMQRWINRDPLGELGGINLYAFAGNGGPNRVDFYGRSFSDFCDSFKKYFLDMKAGAKIAAQYIRDKFAIGTGVANKAAGAGAKVVGSAADAAKAAPGMLAIGVLATNNAAEMAKEPGDMDLEALEKTREKAQGISRILPQ